MNAAPEEGVEGGDGGQLEIIEPSAKSKLWIDAIRKLDYEKYVLELPEPALLNTLKYLRLPDLETVKLTCPELADLVEIQLRHLDEEFPRRPHFRFERCAPPEDVDDENHLEQMSQRQNASVTYYAGDRCVYLFGGETLDRADDGPKACFNDLWKLDTATMKWSRVVITSAPYPSPKCQASFVTWGDQLILYGGRAYRHDGRQFLFSELHFFDIPTSMWHRRTVSPVAFQRPMAGHSVALSRNFMIMYGGFQEDGPRLRNGFLTVLDLRNTQFHYIEMSRVEQEEEEAEPDDPRFMNELNRQEMEDRNLFPRFDAYKSKLVLIREGLLLLAGELHPADYGRSVLIEFDPNADLKNSTWRWRQIETSGRWWRSKFRAAQGIQHPIFAQLMQPVGRERRPDCALPNFEFWEIAEVRNSTTIRLVSLGRLENERDVPRIESADRYDEVQSHYREFVRHLQRHLESEFELRPRPSDSYYTPQDTKTCAVFKFSSIQARIENCFRDGSGKAKPIKIRLQISDTKDERLPKLDDHDKWELRQAIRAAVNQLHSKYYRRSEMKNLAPRVPNRNSQLNRLSIYTAEIDINVNVNEFKELVWVPQPMQFPSPPETRNYSLIGAHHEVIMHGGGVPFNQTMHRMGHTTLLTPTGHREQRSRPLLNLLNRL